MNHFHIDCLFDSDEDLEHFENDKNFICRKCIGNSLPFNQLIEQDFENAINDLTTNITQHNRETLENLVFNPFEIQHAMGNKRNDMLGNLNPDQNYFVNTKNGTMESNYYLTNDFSDIVNQKYIKENQFSILSLNIRSISHQTISHHPIPQ